MCIFINSLNINGLINRLQRANEELGITLCVIEHNMRVIMNLASHIYCLSNGKMLADGKPEQLLDVYDPDGNLALIPPFNHFS